MLRQRPYVLRREAAGEDPLRPAFQVIGDWSRTGRLQKLELGLAGTDDSAPRVQDADAVPPHLFGTEDRGERRRRLRAVADGELHAVNAFEHLSAP